MPLLKPRFYQETDMNADDFRALALSLPNAVESSHMNHPDFRVPQGIFATLGFPDDAWGMMILPSEEQARLCQTQPNVFVPAKGAWGKAGSTLVNLQRARKTTVGAAMQLAWQKRVTQRPACTSKRRGDTNK